MFEQLTAHVQQKARAVGCATPLPLGRTAPHWAIRSPRACSLSLSPLSLSAPTTAAAAAALRQVPRSSSLLRQRAPNKWYARPLLFPSCCASSTQSLT